MNMSLSEIDGISDCETLITDDLISNLGTDFEFSETLSSDEESLSSDFLYTDTNYDILLTDDLGDESNIADFYISLSIDTDTNSNTLTDDLYTNSNTKTLLTSTDIAANTSITDTNYTLPTDVTDSGRLLTDDTGTDTDTDMDTSSNFYISSPEYSETANDFKTLLSNTDLITLSTDDLYDDLHTEISLNDLRQSILIFAIHICVYTLYYWFR